MKLSAPYQNLLAFLSFMGLLTFLGFFSVEVARVLMGR